jgi:uncharacterized Zn finger protein (UPF0148 family)
MVLTNTGSAAFDQLFHRGVNIIRGQNSSGKSTIANFIFYVLGGDYTNWTTEALKCSAVIAEVEINGAVLTLRRNVSENGLQPMSIFWDNLEASRKDSVNWQTYPYKQTSNTISYTNVLFNALSFPEVKNDLDSNITIHQILRLLYIDQETPTQNLFRFERFDLPLTRQAISEVLLGIYDDGLYNQRIDYRNAQRESDEKRRQFDGISKVYGQSGEATSLVQIQNEIAQTQEELAAVDKTINDLREKLIIRTTKRTALDSENIQEELIPTKNKIQEIKGQINQYEIEIADSKLFISTLEKRISELEYSLLTRKVLGELPLTHCPQCLSPLENHVEEGFCFLCKQPLSEESERANAKRLKQEMQIQIKESRSILEEKESKLVNLNSELPVHIEKARLLQRQLDNSIQANQSTRDQRIDSLLVSKGGIEKKIEYLTKQIKAAEMLELLKKELAELSARIESLRIEILQKENLQRQKLDTALQKIRDLTIYILKNDLDRQEEFRNGHQVEVNFLKDTYALDGVNNFSASSKTYFKNAVLFSIFFASLELEFFRYPRFILCDNMEDKGMEKERTQNFQTLITSMSDKYGDNHQIIFTTSMVADDLNNTPYCVGDQFDVNHKTLRF